MKKNDLSIVIVSWNTKEVLDQCLQSIKKYPPSCSYDVWVVDNASLDRTVEYITKKFPWVKVIANSENIGFAKANNQVLKNISSVYALILNPDTQLKKGSVDRLISLVKNDSQIGASGPLLLNPDQSIQMSGYYRRVPSVIQVLCFYTQLQQFCMKFPFLVRTFWEPDLSVQQNYLEVDQIPGACLLAKTAVLKKVGYFDEDYPLWFEDVDLCYKLKQSGYKLWVVTGSHVMHIGGVSFSKWQNDAAKQIRFVSSLLIFFQKHSNILSYIIIRITLLLDTLYLVITRSIRQWYIPTVDRKQFIKNKWEVVKCLFLL